jgi:hypothetical protein
LRKLTISLLLCVPAWCQHRSIVISHIAATNVGLTAATITWSTNVPASSIVYYGVSTSYSSTASDSSLTTDHSITLSNLSSGTLYDFAVQSVGTRSSSESSNETFQTNAASGSSGASGASGASGSLWTEIASDMTGQNEAAPAGVPSSFDWAQGPTISMGNNPNGWQAITSWGGVFPAAQGNPSTNTRVNIRDLQLYFLQASTGKWLVLQNTSQPTGENYLADFEGDQSWPGDVRTESDGTISINVSAGYCFHFWPQDRASINPNDVGGILAIFQARLIVANPSLPDDRSIAEYVAGAGADYYPALTGGWPGNLSYNPGVGTGKIKYVQSEWRFYSMTTLSAQQLANNPPPVNLTGVAP